MLLIPQMGRYTLRRIGLDMKVSDFRSPLVFVETFLHDSSPQSPNLILFKRERVKTSYPTVTS